MSLGHGASQSSLSYHRGKDVGEGSSKFEHDDDDSDREPHNTTVYASMSVSFVIVIT